MNLTNFLAYVKLDFKRTDKDTEIIQAYNDSLIAIAIKMPHGAYKYTSYVPTVAKQPDYPLPSTIMHLIHPIRLTEGNSASDSGWPLERLTKQRYDELEPNPFRTNPDTCADPWGYVVHSGVIMPYPIPDDADHFLEADWTKTPTDQSGGSDTPALPDHWREVLKHMTLKRVNEGIGLLQEAQYFRSLYEDNLGNPIGLFLELLNIEKNKEQSSIGLVTPNNL